MKKAILLKSILILFYHFVCIAAYVPLGKPSIKDIKSKSLLQVRGGSTQLRLVLNPAAASVLAGSIAGAIGVGEKNKMTCRSLINCALK
jgi:hypothetical protein